MLSCTHVMYSHTRAFSHLIVHFTFHSAFSCFIAFHCASSHFIVHHRISSRIITFHCLLPGSAYPCPTTSLVRHIPCLMVVTSIAALLHVITYYQHVFFLSLLCLMWFCLVYSLMITLLLSPITPLYCTCLTIGFYSEVVVAIRVHFVLPMVIVIGLD
jgi:hypothetical protein